MLLSRLKYEKYTDANHLLLSVLDVYLGGPAHLAGLVPFKDFVIGTNEITSFKDLAMFSKYLQVNIGRQIELIVYNSDSGKIRYVCLQPHEGWGRPEQGLIGA